MARTEEIHKNLSRLAQPVLADTKGANIRKPAHLRDQGQCAGFFVLMHRGSSTDIAIPACALRRMSRPTRLRREPAPKHKYPLGFVGCTIPRQKVTVMPSYVAPVKKRWSGAGGCFGISTRPSYSKIKAREPRLRLVSVGVSVFVAPRVEGVHKDKVRNLRVESCVGAIKLMAWWQRGCCLLAVWDWVATRARIKKRPINSTYRGYL